MPTLEESISRLHSIAETLPETWREPLLARLAADAGAAVAPARLVLALKSGERLPGLLAGYEALAGKPFEAGERGLSGATADDCLRAMANRIQEATRGRLRKEIARLAAERPGLKIKPGKHSWSLIREADLARTLEGSIHPITVRTTVESGPLLLESVASLPALQAWFAKALPDLDRKVDRAVQAFQAFADQVGELRARFAAQPAMDLPRFDVMVAKAARKAKQGFPALPALEAEARAILGHSLETVGLARAIRAEGLESYRDFFPQARSLGRRRLLLLVGPTNSGKTYRGLNLLAGHESGVYLAPLRLLALEGQEQLARRGRPASYLTGEERDLVEGARFVASTIEMLDHGRIVDAILIDEVQNLADPERGWAWTQAIVGAPAGTVIMTGSPDAIPLVEALASYTGEELEIERLERLAPLQALAKPVKLEGLGEPGTAIVAFSRRDVLGLKQLLEKRGVVASVIYGSLSPEVRREEARRFREGETKVLVATDAIGMGLNLPIRRVVFHTLVKWDGLREVGLSLAQVLQIGGRAGRHGLMDAGFVGAMTAGDAKTVHRMLGQPLPVLPRRLKVRPSTEHLEAIETVLPGSPMEAKLDLFRRKMVFDTRIMDPSVSLDMLTLARTVDGVQKKLVKGGRAGLSIADQYVFVCAPVSLGSDLVMDEHLRCLMALANRTPIGPPPLGRGGQGLTHQDLGRLEDGVKALTLFCWLAYRYPDLYVDLDRAETDRHQLNARIEAGLRSQGLTRTCESCGRKIDPLVRHRRCDKCSRSGWGGR